MRKMIWINIVMLFVLSCKEGKERQPVSSSETLTAVSKPVSDTSTAVKNDSSGVEEQKPSANDNSINGVLRKLEKQVKLNDADYQILYEFLLHNKDESLSEGAGYSLFQYLKNNKANNEAYLSFLNKKDKAQKEKILGALVEIMCIDIGDENYTYEKFVEDFSIFNESASAKKAFNTCMSNQVK